MERRAEQDGTDARGGVLVGMVFSCFVLRVLKKCSATRGDTDCKEVFGVKKTRAGGNLKESDYTSAETSDPHLQADHGLQTLGL